MAVVRRTAPNDVVVVPTGRTVFFTIVMSEKAARLGPFFNP